MVHQQVTLNIITRKSASERRPKKSALQEETIDVCTAPVVSSIWENVSATLSVKFVFQICDVALYLFVVYTELIGSREVTQRQFILPYYHIEVPSYF